MFHIVYCALIHENHLDANLWYKLVVLFILSIKDGNLIVADLEKRNKELRYGES